MNDLPEFRHRSPEYVSEFLSEVLSHGSESMVEEIAEFPDQHYRVLFRRNYFILPAGVTEPSRSQWNTLKKKFKRHDKSVFVFKEHGMQGDLYYIDFGFFAH